MNSKSVFDRLIREGKLKKQKTDVVYLNSLLESARRNFEAAAFVRGRVNEAAFKLLYDGLLQVSRMILLLEAQRLLGNARTTPEEQFCQTLIG